jgi:hypothetical protein
VGRGSAVAEGAGSVFDGDRFGGRQASGDGAQGDRACRLTTIRDCAESNGNGNGHVDAETAERLRDAAGLGEPIEGQTDLSDFIAEAGEAVGPMPPREMDAGETVHVEEIRVDGSTQLAFDCGGRLADESKLTLSGSASVRGFFKKGDRITGTFEAVVDGVGSKDKYDKQTGVIKDTAQSHSARITDMTVGWRN